MADYAAAKARVLNGRVAVVGLDDAGRAALLDTAPAPVRVGFRLGEPAAGELGVRDGQLVDRAFADDLALLPVDSIPVPGPVGVLDALAAAALARSRRCARRGDRRRRSRRSGWAGTGPRWWPSPTASHTSTTPRPPTRTPPRRRSLAYPRVVWVAGGLLKGASLEAEVGRWRIAAGRSGADRPRPRKRLQRRYRDTRRMSPSSRL